MRVWDMGGSSTKNLDYSERNGDGSPNGGEQNQEAQTDLVRTIPPARTCFWLQRHLCSSLHVLGVFQGMQLSSMKGDLPSVDYESSEEGEMEEEEERVVVSATSKTR